MNESEIIIFIFVSIGIMVALVVSLVIFFNFSQKKIIAQKERNHLLKMNFQKEMLESTINTQEAERSRIARELHDDISSKLNIINVNVDFIKLKIDDQGLQSSISSISSALKESLERSRKISHELMPPILEKFGLEDAINDLMNQINLFGVLKMNIIGSEHFKNIVDQKKLHIFRIIQELINNTIKHAEATNIKIEAFLEKEILEINYSDDGKGIVSTKNSIGIGTMNIESRVQILNASWENIPQETGIKYKFKIPYA